MVVDEDHGLVTVDAPEGTRVALRDVNRDQSVPGRVDKAGIVRQVEGSAAFAEGPYELLEVFEEDD